MKMSPEAAGKSIGWAVIIALVGLCISVLSGSKAGGVAAGRVEARVSAAEMALVRHENSLEDGADDQAQLRVEVAREVSILKTDVKYIRSSMDGMNASQREFHTDIMDEIRTLRK